MRHPLFAAGTALLLCTTAAMAQNNAPNAPASSPSATSASTTGQTPLRENIRGMLQRSGFSNIRIMASSFMIRAQDQQGNPVIMSVSPDSVTEISELGTSGANTPSDKSADTSGATGPQFVAVGQDEKLSSNIVGLDVYNASKQNIGQIKDIAMGPAGRARAYIVSVGGFLGMGTHYVAMNPSDVQVSYNTSDQKWHATTNATSDQLKSAPAFQYTGRWDASKS
jgi:PRC-barrel domain